MGLLLGSFLVMYGACRPLLRVAEDRENEAAFCFEVNDGDIVRFRRNMGSLERLEGAGARNLLDSDHDSKCSDITQCTTECQSFLIQTPTISGSTLA